ncbi:MAG: ImmA/IrrE family metallo-endopeptidase [Syntrophales bacterium]|nr:ImmA/IrrE family metallo-endopeptidase [Syntrophales bacterium]
MESYEFRCKWFDKNDLWKIANDVRDMYWPEGILPVDTEKIIEFRLKLDIEPKHDLFSTVDMDAYLKMDLTGIVVDYDSYMNERFATRMRFSFAHELGHFFLHKDVFSKFDLVSIEDWKCFILNVPENEYRNFEWQANEFAGRLLVPRAELKIEIGKVLEIIEENNLSRF